MSLSSEDNQLPEKDFLLQVRAVVEQNIANEQFGVSELADAMNMSRSNLLRKVKRQKDISVSQLIRQVRLEKGMEMLRQGGLNVSEVSLRVGFGSVSYFIKCFREHYGFPPGEVGKRDWPEMVPAEATPTTGRRRVFNWIVGGLAAATVVVAFVWFYPSEAGPEKEKSIAVLPFKNDSSDSANVFLVNGLMESTLNHLQKIKDMKVISRTSAEKYRNSNKSIPEMGRELNVNYFVEGSGQKIGNEILLNVQLIDAATDKHLWATQYKREISDIFQLQQEVATNIAREVQATITKEEEKRIEAIPTQNLEAYNLFLEGRELLIANGDANLQKAIRLFNKAIELDAKFAEAYAFAAMAYYYLDVYMAEKKFGVEISNYADKAMSFHPDIPESQVAKALYYAHRSEYPKAVPHLEQALAYYPNSADVINLLADLYCYYIPNTTKYLEYALKAVKLDIASQDSVATSNTFLRLANALVQNGFVDEALKYVNKSLDYNPDNPFAEYVKVFILYGKENDVVKAKNRLLKVLERDTTRIDILQDVGKLYYFMRNFDSAYHYYSKFDRFRIERKLDIYTHENIRVAYVYNKMGKVKEAEALLRDFKTYADGDKTIYRELNFSIYHAFRGDNARAMDHMRMFLKEDDFQYWILLGPIDPALDELEKIPEFDAINAAIRTKFWRNHDKLRGLLKDKGLL